jgi:hypothetical protein
MELNWWECNIIFSNSTDLRWTLPPLTFELSEDCSCWLVTGLKIIMIVNLNLIENHCIHIILFNFVIIPINYSKLFVDLLLQMTTLLIWFKKNYNKFICIIFINWKIPISDHIVKININILIYASNFWFSKIWNLRQKYFWKNFIHMNFNIIRNKYTSKLIILKKNSWRFFNS